MTIFPDPYRPLYYNSNMASKRSVKPAGKIRNARGLVFQSVIQRVVKQIAKRFQPDKIMLFGSYARGCARAESDVDLLVVMRARNEIDQSLRIENYLDASFGIDVVVRTPQNLRWRLKEGDWFLREAVAQGKLLYEKADGGMAAQSRRRSGSRPKNSRQSSTAAR